MKKISMKPKPEPNAKAADEWVAQSSLEASEKIDGLMDNSSAPKKVVSLAETGRVERLAQSTPRTKTIPNPDQIHSGLKRLTIDIPEDLHVRIKMQCAARRSKMADEIRLLLQQHFSP